MSINFTKTAKLYGEYDVVVAGGGVAGVAAAVSSARLGKKVALIEKSQKLGGLATLGLVNFFVPMCNGNGKQIIKGMAEEFLRLSIKYGYDTLPNDFVNGVIPKNKLEQYRLNNQVPPRYETRFSAEIFALAMTELCAENGIGLIFDSIVTDIVTAKGNSNLLEGIIIQNKSGAEYVKGKMFVDTTGDCEIITALGMPTLERGNYHIYYGYKASLEGCKKAIESKNIYNLFSWSMGGTVNLYGHSQPKNIPLYYGNNSSEVNRYIINNQLEMLNKIKNDDRFERDIVTLPGMPQFRTTRCLDADYTLKEDDTYRHFEDSIGAINDFDRRDYLFEVPFRTMVKKGYSNIITAGRSASGENYAWDVLRVIPPAIITGQAAGVACAHAIDQGCAINNINILKLQKELEKQDVLIHFNDADVPIVSRNVHEFND